MATYSRDDVIKIQNEAFERGRNESKKYIEKLEIAVKQAFEWLDNFGKHAPIQFGGEQELNDVLLAALTAQHSVQADCCPRCGSNSWRDAINPDTLEICTVCGNSR